MIATMSVSDGHVELPKTIARAVADRLRAEIRSGELAPGTHLRQAHVAERYGVSTTPVREAFTALEREGLLHSVAHKGVVVFHPTGEDLREIYEIRIPLEALATERAVPNLREEDLAALAELLKRMAAADRKGDMARSGELNDAFHRRIYEAAGRPRLASLIADLRASSRAYTRLFAELAPRLEQTEAEHQAIYDACVARAAKRAAKAMTAHLQHTVDVVAAGLDPQRNG